MTDPDELTRLVSVHAGRISLLGDLSLPDHPNGLIVFAHGSGSGRMSPRNRAVAEALTAAGFATLLFDLLSREEEAADRYTMRLRFDIGLLARRLLGALEWVGTQPELHDLPVGLFGASTGAAAALIAASSTNTIRAVVSRGGRPDLAADRLRSVECPTLLLVGDNDVDVLALNQRARQDMCAATKLHIVPGAGHLFEEPGALDEVTRTSVAWFQRHLAPATHEASAPL